MLEPDGRCANGAIFSVTVLLCLLLYALPQFYVVDFGSWWLMQLAFTCISVAFSHTNATT